MPETITKAERWRKQEVITARKLNQTVQAAEDWRRNIPEPTQIIEDGGSRRWFHIKNVDKRQIAGYAMVEITKVVSTKLHNAVEHYEVKRPTQDSITGNVMITDGRTILPGDPGLAAFAFRPMRVNYAGDDPELDDIRGTEEDSFELTADQAGFEVLGVIDSKNKVAIVREVGSAAAFFKDGTVVDENQASTVLYNPAVNSLLARHDEVTSPASDKETWVVLALERPVAAINMIALPADKIQADFDMDGVSGDAASNDPKVTVQGITSVLLGDKAKVKHHIENLTWNLAQSLALNGSAQMGPLHHKTDISDDVPSTESNYRGDIGGQGGLWTATPAPLTTGPYRGILVQIENDESPVVEVGSEMESANSFIDIPNPLKKTVRRDRGFVVFAL